MKWGSLFTRTNKRKLMELELEEKERVYHEVVKAHNEWERAYRTFQEALGKDEVDVAIYTLEAAERRYQIQLKEAKKLKVRFDQHGHFTSDRKQPVRRLGT